VAVLYSGASQFLGGGALRGMLGGILPGAMLLGLGLLTHSGQATAIGGGMLASSVLGMAAHATTGALSTVLGAASAAAPGIGIVLAGRQTGGVAGGLMSAAGGALTGFALGGPIGAAIGAIAGFFTGLFGHKDNTKAWLRAIERARQREHIMLPPPETFAFALGSNLAETFSHTFSEGPGGVFSPVALPQNTPFWATPIVGTPRGWRAARDWNELMQQFNQNLPFFGFGPNPWTGIGTATWSLSRRNSARHAECYYQHAPSGVC